MKHYNDLRQAMILAGDSMIHCLDRDHHNLPYWMLDVDENYNAYFLYFSPNHNLGRWWDAMLRLERSLGYAIQPEAEAAMLHNLQWFVDNEDHYCIEPDDASEKVEPLETHSMRETLLAFTMLIACRNSKWAREAAHAMLLSIDEHVGENCEFDLSKTAYHRDHDVEYYKGDPTATTGRMIESLVLYYELTGDDLAFQLAERFSQWHFLNSTMPDGSLPENISHTHSYLCTLRGLFLFGKLTNRRYYIERVLATYKTTVCRIVKESGFACHDMGLDTRAETTSPGDAAQLALWLGLDGYLELLDDAERIVRARILPSQITKTPKLTPMEPSVFQGHGTDKHRDLEKRILGGFGGMQRSPHGGKRHTIDVTAADLHTLTDIYDHIVVEDQNTTKIFFHFCYESENVQVDCLRTNHRCALSVRSETGKRLEVRVPRWTPKDSVVLTVNGVSATPVIRDGFLRIMTNGQPVTVELSYDLPEKTIIERSNEVDYTICFRGDEVLGISPNTDFYPLYDTLEL